MGGNGLIYHSNRYTYYRGTHHTSPGLHPSNEDHLCNHETDAQIDVNVATHTP